jgi:hypothetical protein
MWGIYKRGIMDNKILMAILNGEDITQAVKKTREKPDTKLVFMDIPERHERAGRGLSQEMKNSQATLRNFPGQPAVVKTFKNKSSAQSSATAMRKSPHWSDFKIEVRDVRVFATFVGE